MTDAQLSPAMGMPALAVPGGILVGSGAMHTRSASLASREARMTALEALDAGGTSVEALRKAEANNVSFVPL
jgi:hypothetical protein